MVHGIKKEKTNINGNREPIRLKSNALTEMVEEIWYDSSYYLKKKMLILQIIQLKNKENKENINHTIKNKETKKNKRIINKPLTINRIR